MRMRNRFLSRGKRRGRGEPYVAETTTGDPFFTGWGYAIPDHTLPVFHPSPRFRMTTGAPAVLEAPSISYSDSPITLYDGIAAGPFNVTSVGGEVASFAAIDALPTGVSLNTTTGEITVDEGSIDPTVQASYTIRATNATGTDNFELVLEILAAPAYTSAGNISYGWGGTSANDAAAGDVAWTNPERVTWSDDSDATVVLNNQSSQYLKITNFTMGPTSIPVGAVITGVEFHVECKAASTTPVCAEAKLIKGGSIVGSDQSESQIVGIYEYRGLYLGGNNALWGTSLGPSDIDANFGLALRVSTTSSETIEVDSVKACVHWAQAPSCVVTVDHATSPQAPCQIHAHILGSTIGDSSWEKVGVRWTITGPGGWSMPSTDYRPGSWGSSRARDCATDMWGYNVGVYADVAGTYTVQATLYLEDGTTQTDSTQVVVGSSTRAVRYLKDDGSDVADGTSLANAWATWEHALSQLTNNMELIVQDDDSWLVSSALANRPIYNVNNVVIRRSGDGTSKPIIEGDGVAVLYFRELEDFVIDGIDIRGEATPEVGVLGSEGNVLRFTMVNVDGSQGHNSFWEKNSGQYARQFLVYNCTFSDLHRYGFYLEGGIDYLVCFIGCQFTASTLNPPTGEGAIRFGTNGYNAFVTNGPNVGYGQNVMWCKFTAESNYAGARVAASFAHSFQNNYGSTVFGCSETANDNSLALTFARRFDGNYLASAASEMVIPERQPNTWVCNTVWENDGPGSGTPSPFPVATLKNGHHVRVGFACNLWLLTNYGSSYVVYQNCNDVGRATFRGFLYAANGFLHDVPENNDLGMGDDGSHASVLDNGGAVRNNICPRRPVGIGRWKIRDVNYDGTSNANAQPGVSGEGHSFATSDSGQILPSDILSSNDFLPSTDFADYRTHAAPEPGVWIDYRGVLRDHEAATWPVGPTGLESA